jgi:hypothetical protein
MRKVLGIGDIFPDEEAKQNLVPGGTTWNLYRRTALGMGENDTGVWYTPSLHDCSLNVHNDREFFISANAGIRQMLCKQYNEADTMCSDTHH